MITLNNIAELIADMKTCQLYRQKFEFKYNQRTVEVMIFIDTFPHEVLVGVFNTRCSFITTISAKGEVKNWIDNYEDLCAALGINYSPIPENILTPQKFFKMLDSHSPTSALSKLEPKPHDRFKYDKNVEECDKIYFCGFRDNNNCGGHMTLHNYLKTQKAFGTKVANYLKVKNISTRWSSSSRDLTDFFLPNK